MLAELPFARTVRDGHVWTKVGTSHFIDGPGAFEGTLEARALLKKNGGSGRQNQTVTPHGGLGKVK